MKLRDGVWIAQKNLLRRKVRSFLTVLSILVGSTVIFISVSMALGVKHTIISQLKKTGAVTEITVRPAIESTFGNGPPGSDSSIQEIGEAGGSSDSHSIALQDVKKIKKLPHLSASAAVLNIDARSIRLEGSSKYYPLSLEGVPIVSLTTDEELSAGRNLRAGDKYAIVLGSSYAETLGFKDPQKIVGKTVVIRQIKESIDEKMIRKMYPQYQDGNIPEWIWRQAEAQYKKNPEYKDFKVKVVGVSANAFDTTKNTVPIALVLDMYKYRWNDYNHLERNGYSSVIIKAESEKYVDQIVKEIKKLGFSAQSMKEMLQGILNVFTIIQTVLALFGGISLLIAMIGIINTMVMNLYERTREIGVMRATGASQSDVVGLFTLEAVLMGFWGGVLGTAIAWLLQRGLVWGMDRYVLGKLDTGSDPVLSLGAVGLFRNPIWLFLGIIGLTSVVGMIAGLFPAWRAGRMSPTDALKFE